MASMNATELGCRASDQEHPSIAAIVVLCSIAGSSCGRTNGGQEMTPIDRITAADAAPAGGHYSPAVGWGDLVFISGQLPVGADGTHHPAAGFADQAERAIANLLAVLGASGGAPADLLKVTVYLVDVKRWAEFNAVYARLIGEAKPARSIVPVPALHHGYLVEIDAIARRVMR